MGKASLRNILHFNKVKRFARDHKRELIVLSLIIISAAFMRLYQIDGYLTFLGDEGRDALIVRRFLVEGDIFLIGPGTSIGNMYLGPLYYYMMAPALLFGFFSPVGPAVMVALLGILTVLFIWWITREWFGPVAGLIAAFLYTISPTVIIYSRSSWNPNIMPFFALLSVYSMWNVYKKREYSWIVIASIGFAFVLQSHYMGLLLAPTLGIMWLISGWYARKHYEFGRFLKQTALGALGFLALMSPLVIFDSRHGWRNATALSKFFLERQTTISARPWNALPDLWPLTQEISTRLLAGREEMVGAWIAIAILVSLLLMYKDFLKGQYKKVQPITYILLWLGVALVGLGVYKQHIYDHYYGFFFPAPFILIGAISGYYVEKARIRGIWIVSTALLFIVYFNLLNSPLREPPNNQLDRTRTISASILEDAGEDSFNLAVIAERNYEAAYQYFLERWNANVVEIDPLRAEETIQTALYVICELPREDCDPTNNPKAEVANFGWSKIEKEWEVEGHTVFKLIHNK